MNGLNFFVLSMLTENSGHLLRDDLFWVKNLIERGERVTILTSKESILNISIKINSKENCEFKFFKDWNWLKEINYRLFLLHRVVKSGRIKNSVLIIQGFEELSILLLLFIIRKNGNKIILVHTNNLSPERMERGGILLEFILRQIFKKCDFICYHSDYVFKRMLDIIGGADNYRKLIRVKYHLFNKPFGSKMSIKEDSIISFFGPTMPSKPILDFCNLMKADNHGNGKFKYRIVNVSDSVRYEIIAIFGNNNKINFINEYLEEEEYIELIRTSSYVFLPHNRLYEGKLSGIFCDSISNSVPVISDLIEPIIEYFKTYGPMGYIFDFDKNQNWTKEFLTDYDDNLYESFKLSMKNCQISHQEVRIIEEFMTTLENFSKYT